MQRRMSRRDMLRYGSLASGAVLLAACQPKIVEVEKIVKETVVVEKEVEKVVKETVIVEGESKVVEKIVKETVVVQVDAMAEKAAKFKGDLVWETWRGPGTGWNEERISAFQEMYPQVNIELIAMPWGDYAKMYAEAAAGDLPDLISFDPGHLVYEAAIENGLLLDITDYADADPEMDLDAWYPMFIEMQKYKGNLYGFPSWGWSGHDCLIANRHDFEELGIEAPAPTSHSTSMDTIGQWIREMHKLGTGPGEVERWGAQGNTNAISSGSFARAWGTELYDPANAKCLIGETQGNHDMFKWLYDMAVVDEVYTVGGDISGNYYSAFAERKAAMQIGGALNIARSYRDVCDPEVADPTTIYYPTQSDGSVPAWIMGGTWNVNKKSKYPEIGYEFIKHISNKEGSLGFNIVAGEGCLTRPDVYSILKIRDEAYAWGEENLFKGKKYLNPTNMRGKELQDTFLQELAILLDRNQPVDFEKGLMDLHDAVQNVLDKDPA